MRLFKPQRFGYRRHRQKRRISRMKWSKILVLLFLFGILLFGGFLGWQKVFEGSQKESITANIKILKGKKVEYLFSDSLKWEGAFDDLKLQAGDSLRTLNKSQASLEILGTNGIYLDENTMVKINHQERDSNGVKTIEIEVLSGHVWVKTSDDQFRDDTGSSFVILGPQVRLNVFETLLDFDITEVGNRIRVAKGAVEVQPFGEDPEAEPLEVFNVKVGQEVLLSPENLQSQLQGEDIIKIIDSDFLESDWHLSKLEIYYPQEAAEIKDRAEKEVIETIDAEAGSDAIEPPQILAPIENTVVPAGQDIKIEGIAPSNAQQIEINGFPLTRFNPGDKKWSYLGSERFGTIHGGLNTYKVVAITRDGKRSAPATLNLMYEGINPAVVPANTKSPQPDNVVTVPIVFDPPRVTHIGKEPVNLGDTAYETSASRITISGSVPKEAFFVEFNGYRLKKFKRGDVAFYYTAILGQNMEEGENFYRIVAIGPNNIQSEVGVKIHYTPLEVVGENKK